MPRARALRNIGSTVECARGGLGCLGGQLAGRSIHESKTTYY